MISLRLLLNILLQSALSAGGIIIVFLVVVRTVEASVVHDQTQAQVSVMTKQLLGDHADQLHEALGHWHIADVVDTSADVLVHEKNEALIRRAVTMIGGGIVSTIIITFTLCQMYKIPFVPILKKALIITSCMMVTEAVFVYFFASKFKIADAEVMKSQLSQAAFSKETELAQIVIPNESEALATGVQNDEVDIDVDIDCESLLDDRP